MAGPLKLRPASRGMFPLVTVDGCCSEDTVSLCFEEVGVEVWAGKDWLFVRGEILGLGSLFPLELESSAAAIGSEWVGGVALMPIWDNCDMSVRKCSSNFLFCIRRCSSRACSSEREGRGVITQLFCHTHTKQKTITPYL